MQTIVESVSNMKRSYLKLCMFFLSFWIFGLYFISTSLYFIGHNERIQTNLGMESGKDINPDPGAVTSTPDTNKGNGKVVDKIGDDDQIWREVKESNVSMYGYPGTDIQDWRQVTCPVIPMTSSKVQFRNLTFFDERVTFFLWNTSQDKHDVSNLLTGTTYHHKYIVGTVNMIYKLDPEGVLVDLGAGLGELSIAAAMRDIKTIAVEYLNKNTVLLCSTLNTVQKRLSEKVLLFTLGNLSSEPVSDMRMSSLMKSSVARKQLDSKPVVIRINSDIDLYQFLLDTRAVYMNLIALLCKWSIADDEDVSKTYRFLRSRNFVPFYMDVFHSNFIRLDGGSLAEWPTDVIWVKLEK